MKVTVNKYLNVRVGKPSLSAPCYQYLAPSSELEVDGNLYEGDKFEGITTWLKDAAGNYYWSGGVESFVITSPSGISTNFKEALNKFSGNGANINVAFIDSGVNDKHIYLKDRIKHYESFISSKSKIKIASHGNLVAGILGSDDPAEYRNKSNLYCYRVTEENSIDVDNTAVKLSLDAIYSSMPNIQIINLSLDVIPQYIPILQPVIDNLVGKDKIIVIAAGENGSKNNIWRLNHTIKVATFDLKNFNLYKSLGFPIKDCIYYLNSPIPSYSINGNSLDSEIGSDSAYCAFTSMIIARALGSGISTLAIKNYLTNISKSIKSVNSPELFTPYQS